MVSKKTVKGKAKVPQTSMTLVGLHGLTGATVGMFLPVFSCGGDRYFVSGDSREQAFGAVEFERLVRQGAVVPFEEPISLGRRSGFVPTRHFEAGLGEGRFPAPSYVLVANADVWGLLESCFSVLEEGAIRDSILAIDDRALNGRKALLARTGDFARRLFPPVMEGARQRFMSTLRQAIRESVELPFGDGHWEMLEKIAQVMVAIAWDTSSLQEAVKYQGLVVLTGPYAANFRAWHSITTKTFHLPPLPAEYCWSEALGLLEKEVVALRYRSIRNGKERQSRLAPSGKAPEAEDNTLPRLASCTSSLQYLGPFHSNEYLVTVPNQNLACPTPFRVGN